MKEIIVFLGFMAIGPANFQLQYSEANKIQAPVLQKTGQVLAAGQKLDLQAGSLKITPVSDPRLWELFLTMG